MSQKVRCEAWYDNTWWEALLPSGWTFRRDQTVKNWPYLFEAPNSSQLMIGASKNNKLSSGWNFSIAPSDLTHEQKQAFLLAASDVSQQDIPVIDIASMQPAEIALMQHALVMNRDSSLSAAAQKLTKHEFSELIGFAYQRKTPWEITWAGYFSHDSWMIRAAFSALPDFAEADLQTVLSILESLRFKNRT